MAECVISLKSHTTAERVRRLALEAGIGGEIVSVDPKKTKRGCSVGIIVACEDVAALRHILNKNGVSYGDTVDTGV